MRNNNLDARIRKDIHEIVYRYNILVNGKHVKNGVKGWKNALAHAQKHQYDLFGEIKKVEIFNVWTGEIVTLEEAERRAAKFEKA